MADNRIGMRPADRLTGTAKDWLMLSRPGASLTAGAELLVGAYLSHRTGRPAVDDALLFRECFAIALVTAAVMVVNDIRDVRADMVSRPDRPLACGRISTPGAWRLAGAEAVGALLLSAAVPSGPVIILALLLIGIGYSYLLKGTVLMGNLVVALLAASPIVYGAQIAGIKLMTSLSAAIVIFTFMFAFEVLKTIRDVVADRMAGYRTVATQWGVSATAGIFRISLAICAVLAAIPVLAGDESHHFAAFLEIGTLTPSLIAAWLLPVASSPTAVRRALHIMAISWIPGLLALTVIFKG